MSNVVKVFIVLNLVLSVAFVAAAATLLGKAENWKKAYETLKTTKDKEIDGLKQANASVRAQLGEQKQATTQAADERNLLQVKVTSMTNDLGDRKRDIEKLQNTVAGLNENLKNVTTTLTQAQTDRETYAKRMESAEGKARKAVTAKESAEEEVRRLEAKIGQMNGEYAQLEKDLNDVRQDLDHKNNLLKIAVDRGFDISSLLNAPPVEAVVQRVNEELKFVMLSAGADDKVVKGMRFHVSRNGSYIGEVQVDYVYPKACSASFVTVKPRETIRAGDMASTRL